MRWTWALYSLICGILAGTAATIFLYALDWATRYREQHPALLYGLPLAGLGIGLVYHHFGQTVARGNNLILDEIHDPKKIVPFRMAPFVLLGTVVTHLFGGSAGREGTAVQMGASLADQLARVFRVDAAERRILLIAGMGAGFGAAIGAPISGVIFGMEVLYVGRFKCFAWLEATVASFTAYGVTQLLHAPHSVYPDIGQPAFDFLVLAKVLAAGVVFGLAARGFVRLAHGVERLLTRVVPYPPLRPFVGGVLVLAFYYCEGRDRYVGLGIPYIQSALQNPALLMDPLAKALATALTVGSGFKGGEFIPLVYIGTTLGSVLSLWLNAPVGVLAATGFAAVFGGAANTPIACAVMAAEIFGPGLLPYALLACLMSYWCSGPHGIYRSQKRARKE